MMFFFYFNSINLSESMKTRFNILDLQRLIMKSDIFFWIRLDTNIIIKNKGGSSIWKSFSPPKDSECKQRNTMKEF